MTYIDIRRYDDRKVEDIKKEAKEMNRYNGVVYRGLYYPFPFRMDEYRWDWQFYEARRYWLQVMNELINFHWNKAYFDVVFNTLTREKKYDKLISILPKDESITKWVSFLNRKVHAYDGYDEYDGKEPEFRWTDWDGRGIYLEDENMFYNHPFHDPNMSPEVKEELLNLWLKVINHLIQFDRDQAYYQDIFDLLTSENTQDPVWLYYVQCTIDSMNEEEKIGEYSGQLSKKSFIYRSIRYMFEKICEDLKRRGDDMTEYESWGYRNFDVG